MPKKLVKSSKTKTSKAPKSKDRKSKPETEIKLAVPWEQEREVIGDGNTINIINTFDDETSKAFISERTRLHETYILEEARTKRLMLVIASVLFLSAVAVILFAPEGRQNLSYWLGGTLFVLSAGAAGYKRIWGKTKNRSIRLE
jgi:hypothetical protein